MHSRLATRTRRAFAWAAAGKLLGQTISWVVTIYVIRLLSPDDYGVMAIAMMCLAMLSLVSELGLTQAIIQADNINTSTLRQLLGIVLVLNVALAMLAVAAAPLGARFFDQPDLTPVLRLLALLFVVNAIAAIPQALLERDLDFRRIAIAELLGNLVGAFATLVLALDGKGVWALALGAVAGSVVRTAAYNAIAPFPHWPSFSVRRIGSLLRFGGVVSLERVVWYLYSQADTFIIAKVIGSTALGYYSVGRDIASLPSQKLAPILNQVLLPAFSRLRDADGSVSSAYMTTVSLASVISFPMFFGLSAVAADATAAVLGERWSGVAPVISLFALSVPLVVISGLTLTTLKAIGRPIVSLGNMLIAAAIMPVAFTIGAFWGYVGVAVAWVIAYPIAFFINLLRSSRPIGTSGIEVARTMAIPAMVAGAMGIAVFGLSLAMASRIEGPITRLGIEVLAGVMLYTGLLWLVRRERTVAELRLLWASQEAAPNKSPL